MPGDENVSEIGQSALDDVDRRALIGIAGTGLVDCGRLVQLTQLMMMPEFDRLFAALCDLDMAQAPRAAETLADCAETLARRPVGDLTEFIEAFERAAREEPGPKTP